MRSCRERGPSRSSKNTVTACEDARTQEREELDAIAPLLSPAPERESQSARSPARRVSAALGSIDALGGVVQGAHPSVEIASRGRTTPRGSLRASSHSWLGRELEPVRAAIRRDGDRHVVMAWKSRNGPRPCADSESAATAADRPLGGQGLACAGFGALVYPLGTQPPLLHRPPEP